MFDIQEELKKLPAKPGVYLMHNKKDEIIYVIELEISQSHFSLDLEEHMKDYMNTITIPIQVSEEYYYSVEIGNILDDEFRIGSYVFKGSIGSWQIKVVDKKIVEN